MLLYVATLCMALVPTKFQLTPLLRNLLRTRLQRTSLPRMMWSSPRVMLAPAPVLMLVMKMIPTLLVKDRSLLEALMPSQTLAVTALALLLTAALLLTTATSPVVPSSEFHFIVHILVSLFDNRLVA
jgi:hypothetical protein